MSASYQIDVLDSAGAVAAILDTTQLAKLQYERRLNDVGMCQFTLPLDDTANGLISKDTLIEIKRFPNPATQQDEGTYITRHRSRVVDSDGQAWAIYGGVSLEWVLLGRFVNPNNDPLTAGGFSTKQDAVDTVMAELADEQAGPTASALERVPYLTISTPAGVGETVSVRLSWESLFETLRNLAVAYDMDFRIERTSGIALAFYAERIGSDKTRTTNFPGAPFVLLSPDLGRAAEPELVEDWKDEKTYVYLLGKGAGDARELYGGMAGAIYDTPYSFAAMVEDARDSNQIADYVTQAQQALAKNRAKKTFGFSVANAIDQYRTLWDIGDKVTSEWEDFSEDMRIIAVKVEIDNDGEDITPEVVSQYD
jgi:hypothetical protein